MSITCEWVEPHLSAYQDGELDAATAETIREHVATCSSCAAILHDYAAHDLQMKTLPPIAPDASLRERLFASPEMQALMRSAEATPPHHMPHVRATARLARAIPLVAIAIILVFGGTVAFSRIFASQPHGASYAACPILAQMPAEQVVSHSDNRLFSDGAKLVCEPSARITSGFAVAPTGRWIASHDHEARLNGERVVTFAWSPDGTMLMVETLSGTTLDLWRVFPDQTQGTLLASAPAARPFSAPLWSPDGHGVAVQIQEGATNAIVLLGQHTPIPSSSAAAIAADVATVPLGTQTMTIAWGQNAGQSFLTGFVPATGQFVRIAGGVAPVVVAKIPFGTIAVFDATHSIWAVAERDGVGSTLSQVQAWDGATTPLAHLGPVTALAWSPDGRTLAALSDRTLWLVNASGITRVADGVTGQTPSWSADSAFLAFETNGQAQMVNRQTLHVQVALIGQTGTIASMAWSPSSDLLAIWKGSDVLVVDRTGGVTATYLVAPDAPPQWSLVG
jgi:hypothetical protein